ncbi:MAG: hypothetical protein IJ572_05185 [Bacilli bacterium]|nr:hypothetical protein [Bacilli bacterium]
MNINEKIELLKKGNKDFSLTFDEERILIDCIRRNKSKNDIINGFLMKLKDSNPLFCYKIIYDNDLYISEALNIFNKYLSVNDLSLDMVSNLLYKTTYGKDIITSNINYFFKWDEYLKVISVYYLSNYRDNKDIVSYISKYNDLHIRYSFMKILITYFISLVDDIYDDIEKYVIYLDNDKSYLMNIDEICDLAISLFENNDITNYKKLKDFIIKNYNYNKLASRLLTLDNETYMSSELNKKKINEFLSDINTFYETSMDYRLYIYDHYSRYLSEKIVMDLQSRLKYFDVDNYYFSNRALENVYEKGLGRKLEEYVDKYLSLSTSDSYEKFSPGTTASAYRIGDYVFKLSKMKWSYEDVICPNLYLIAKNLEEDFVRDQKGRVIAGIEVQKYYSKSPKDVGYKYFVLWRNQLNELGYYITDSLINGSYGDNSVLLDSYLEADIDNPNMVPDWFKEVPLVLIDRDRIYKIENKKPKQLKLHI